MRRIEFCGNPVNRLEYDVLRNKYEIQHLDVRRKRDLLQIMYKQSKIDNNVGIISHYINLRSRDKVKL